MANAVITDNAKIKLLKARAGDIPFAKITKMAFGIGGVNANGEPIEPLSSTVTLSNEVLRKDLVSHNFDGKKSMKYTCTIRNNECVGMKISEIALVDSDNEIVCIKTFAPKQKDADIEMTFDIYDTF